MAAALLLLWQRGYVEPVTPPVLPRHIVAQQLLGLVLQERRLLRAEMFGWLGGLADVPGAGDVLAYLIGEGFSPTTTGLSPSAPALSKSSADGSSATSPPRSPVIQR